MDPGNALIDPPRSRRASVTVASIRAGPVPALTCAAILATAWLALAPQTADLAAQVYRTDLFSREGFALWDNSWFAGHHLPAYSLLFPPLSATFGPRAVAVSAVMTSSLLFAHLMRDQGIGRRRAIMWFGCAAAGDLFIGRLTFALGVACAMACLVAVAHRRPRTALTLGALTAAASPVSALLLAIVLAAWMPTLPQRWQRPAVIAMPLAVAGLLTLAFPEGGTQPFELRPALLALAITTGVAVALPPTMAAARRGTLLYALAIVAAYVVPTPMGSNIARLGVLVAGPLLMLGANRRQSPRRALTVLTATAIISWQLFAPITEVLKTDDALATSPSYFEPLLKKLSSLPPGRIEVVPTATRWESVYVARQVPLARGWETQLDRRYNALFYTSELDRDTYVRWLRRLAVSYVAISDAPTERWGRNEARLLRSPPPALRLIWRSPHWRVFAVRGSAPLVSAGRLIELGGDTVTVALPAARTTVVRVRYHRFWEAGPHACVTRSALGFTRITTRQAGIYTLRARLDVPALLGDRDGCHAARR